MSDPNAINQVFPQDASVTPDELVAGENTPVLEEGEILEELSSPSDDTALPAGDDDTSLPAPTTPKAATDASTVMALQAIIGRQSAKLDELKQEAKQMTDSLRSIVENDQELSQIEEQAKEATRKQKERKQMLSNNPESTQIKYKLKELKDSIKDVEESLNNHLLNFYQMTGVKVFDTEDGSQREFEVRAKLRGKKKAE